MNTNGVSEIGTDLPAIRKTAQMMLIERLDAEERGEPVRDIRLVLKDDIENLGTITAVAKKYELDISTVQKWLDRLEMTVEQEFISTVTLPEIDYSNPIIIGAEPSK